MNDTGIGRLPRKIKTLPDSVEIAIPLDINKTITDEDYDKIMTMYEDENDCYGKEFDIKTNDCASCADNEVCGILFGNMIRAKAKEMDKVHKYLDKADFTLVDKGLLKLQIKTGMLVDDLFDKVSEQSKCTDEVAVVEFIRRWVLSDEQLYIKDGVVNLRS